jgi:hypothetical protein
MNADIQDWESVEFQARAGNWRRSENPQAACILELRARVEALEARVKALERAWTPAPQTPEQVAAGLREAFHASSGASKPASPAGGNGWEIPP